MGKIRICGQKAKVKATEKAINPTLKAWKELLPINLGPCLIYGGKVAKNVESAWESTKVYEEFTHEGQPKEDYFKWAAEQLNNDEVKKNKSPILYHMWNNRKLGIIEARKSIYAPLYIKAVTMTDSWAKLKELYRGPKPIVIRDPSSYDLKDRSLTEVLYDHKKPFGFSFLLMMLLTNDPATREFA
jgi:hypothetical protein